MSIDLKYSILRYSPSIVAGESINLGIAFYSEAQSFRNFIYTKRFQRIKEFDDEIDIDVVKALLKSIENEINVSIENYNSPFNLEEYIRYYTNEYKFDKPISVTTDSFDDTVDEIKKIYLRYDYEKKERLSREQEINFISRILHDKHVQYQRNEKVKGVYGENVVYDYVFMDYGIKLFLLNGKSLNRVFNDIKAWAWNCEKSKDIIKTIILYDYDTQGNDVNEGYFNSILKILKSSSKNVYPIDDGINFINKTIRKQS